MDPEDLDKKIETPEDKSGEDKGGEPKGISFENEEAFNAAVDKVVATREQAQKEAEEEAQRQAEADKDRFMPKDYKAKDWDEAAKTMYPAFRERFREELKAEQETYRKKINEINKGFDSEIENLRKTDQSIPETGTKERTDFDRELASLGVKYGVNNMTQAYNIYKLVHPKDENKEEGKADIRVEGENRVPVEEPKAPPSPRMQDLATKVSSKSKTSAGAGDLKYSRIAGNSLDNLVAEELEKMQS